MARIDIVGAGVAGLALAAALDPARHDVALHDDRAGLPEVGTAFGMWPVAQRALARLGLADEVRRHSVRVDVGALRDARGRALVVTSGQDVRLVTRPTLLRLLETAVPATVEHSPARVVDPAALAGDLVVGADGTHSVVRLHWWGDDAAPRPTGFVAFRGVVPGDHASHGLDEYWGRRALFGVTPNPGHATNWFCAVPETRYADVGAGLVQMRQRFAAYPDVVRDVLARATPERTLVNRIYAGRTLGRLARGRAVLVGDAAHTMPPNLGRGACESLVDAVTLGALLNTSDDPAAAVRDYQRRRRLPARAVAVASHAVLRVSVADGAASWRDRALRGLGSLVPG